MIVVCTKNSNSLIKGCQYEVDALYYNKLHLKGIVGMYSTVNFKTLEGEDLPNNITFNNRQKVRLNIKDIKKGNILICTTDKYKTYIEGGKYKVEYVETQTKNELDRFNNIFSYDVSYIKFEGIKRKLKFGYNTDFRKYTKKEHRDIKIDCVIHNKKDELIDTSKRKIEAFKDKDDYLLKILSRSIVDNKRHHLSIIEWAVKIGNKFQIKESDFDEFLDMKLSDILNKIK